MKRIAALLLAGIMLIGLCAATAEEWTFDRGITIVCPCCCSASTASPYCPNASAPPN